MPQLTADEAARIAQLFAGFAQKVADFRFAHINDLSDQDMAVLRDRETSLRATSNDFLDQGINRLLDDAQSTLQDLDKVTDLLKQDLTKLNDLNRVLQAATSLIQLGTACASENPDAIAAALKSTFLALKPADEKKQAAG